MLFLIGESWGINQFIPIQEIKLNDLTHLTSRDCNLL